MASALYRTTSSFIRRPALISMVRASSGGGGPPVDQHKGKVASDKVTMPDGLGHAVGLERFELLAKLAGNEDPFEMNIREATTGTLKDPNLVPSLFEKRLVGCICEEDAISINWMMLHKGVPTRCECGYWFKLNPTDPKDLDYSWVIEGKKKE